MKMKKAYIFFLIALGIIFSGCNPKLGTSGLRGKNTSTQNITGENLSLGQGYVLADSPIALTGNAALDPNYNLNSLLTPANITLNGFLRGPDLCNGLQPCHEVMAKQNSSVLQTTDGKWAYNSNTEEFLQVNSYYHLEKIFTQFKQNLQFSNTMSSLIGNNYTAFPLSPLAFRTTPLKTYANCDFADNAYFDYTNFVLCFGYVSGQNNMKFAQDSSIIYHEAGHFFQKLQLNFRNVALNTVNPETNMGGIYYSEASVIGEGLSDFYSYYGNGRTIVGDWAVGRVLNASRPVSENESMHVAGVSIDPSQRLSYPQFINYNPNNPQVPVEEIHYGGMILSHYLVALTEELQTYCGMTKRDAGFTVTHLLSETLAELGDLTTKGTRNGALEGSIGKVNYKPAYSKEWYRITNPINYRSFAQTFAKNIYRNLTTLSACNGSPYPSDRIEMLLDDYGLLLFRTYNEHRNFADPATMANTPVKATNRKKSTLISKTLIKLDPTPGASTAFVIDSQQDISREMETLTQGTVDPSLLNQTPSDYSFNNNNARVSPGEVVGIALNLYNDSNATMGGVQVLANDWNHVDPVTGKPYIFDQWPLVSEGGVAAPATVSEVFSPVCLIQSKSADGSSTQWITQKAYRQIVAVDQTMCLNNSTAADSDKDCFIRALTGADQAIYSKIGPKSTWGQTLANPLDPQTATAVTGSNIIMFQVSKHVPPGTVVNCRLRVRFTNCDDCFHDPNRQNYDYKDIDYNGAAPFKIISLQFSIVD